MSKDTQPSIAETLRKLRLAAGYSQQNVADVLNVNRSTYTYYETGKTMPDIVSLYKIARMFGVPIDVFFYEEKLSKFEDSNRRRPAKIVPLDAKKVGDLKSEEKDLIAWIRANEANTKEVLKALKSKLESSDKQ